MEKGNTEKNPSKASNLSESTFAEGNLFGDSEMQKLAEEAIRANNAPHRKGRKRSTLTEARPPLSAERMRELLAEIHEIETPNRHQVRQPPIDQENGHRREGIIGQGVHHQSRRAL